MCPIIGTVSGWLTRKSSRLRQPRFSTFVPWDSGAENKRASARAHPAATPPPPSPKLHPSRERRGLRAHGRRGRAPVASNRQKVTSEVALRDHCSNGPKHVPPRRLGTIYGMEVAPSSGFLPSSCDDFRICPFYENYLPRYYPAPSLLWAPALQVPIVLQERC
ncbi:hypothetical protein KM043_016786 [Ampulex compressa]|nr:hypothetical protein KM043_016786 [Ampulex compressa]